MSEFWQSLVAFLVANLIYDVMKTLYNKYKKSSSGRQ